MRNRGVAAIGIALVLALSGCSTPEPPAPTPTAAFASEEEAFAAAEATYRAYVEALNAVDLSDPETFEGVYEWTTGELNSTDRKSFSQWHADEFEKVGNAAVLSFQPSVVRLESEPTVTAKACLDISNVDIYDGSGSSVVGADRPDIQSLEVTLVRSATSATGMQIAALNPVNDEDSC